MCFYVSLCFLLSDHGPLDHLSLRQSLFPFVAVSLIFFTFSLSLVSLSVSPWLFQTVRTLVLDVGHTCGDGAVRLSGWVAWSPRKVLCFRMSSDTTPLLIIACNPNHSHARSATLS